MDVASILQIFRLMAAEYSGITDAVVTQWITLTAPLVSRKRFGKVYEQALALYTAHRMELAQVIAPAADSSIDVGAITAAKHLGVSSYTEGETSISFNTNLAAATTDDADLASTQYGIQYLNLRRMRIMPIISAGANRGRA